MSNLKIELATITDVQVVKNLINEMYGFEYETRDVKKFGEVIKNKEQIFVLATLNDVVIGFAGASTNSNEYLEVTTKVRAVIEYVYVKNNYRGLIVAYELIKDLIRELLNLNINSALMQVQTYNEQRYLHYALSDKNIIKSTYCENYGKKYYDEILLIQDLKKVSQLTLNEFINKIRQYS